MRLGSSIRRRRGRHRGARAAGSGSTGTTRAWPRPSRTVVSAVFVSLFGVFAGFLVATRIVFPAPKLPSDLVAVPDLRGQSLDAALTELSAAGLEVGSIEKLHDPAIDSGSVVGQAPLPGQLSRPSRPVRLTLSRGAERRQVPVVAGLRLDHARTLLASTGLSVALDSIESSLPRGRIVAVFPAEGTDLALPGEVRLMVSLGPPTVLMPSLLGLSERTARDTLDALGLVVDQVQEIFRFGRDQGRVVGQRPPADTEVQRGESVQLLVGRRGRRGGEQ